MRSLELVVPPPVVMLMIALLMWLLALFIPALSFIAISNLLIAVIVAVVGLVISTAGILSFRNQKTTIDPRKPAEVSALVTSGVYRFTRNPMYLGTLLILIGWGIYLGNALALVSAFLYVPYINRYQIQSEEQLLQDKFGAQFSAYKTKVRKWI